MAYCRMLNSLASTRAQILIEYLTWASNTPAKYLVTEAQYYQRCINRSILGAL